MRIPLRVEVVCWLIGYLLVSVALMSAGVARAASPDGGETAQVRGTWMTTTANDALSSPEAIDRSFAHLKAIGLDTVYVEVWKNGYTQFPSETLQKTIGLDRKPDLMPANNPALSEPRDLLQEMIDAARRHDLRVIAWFEYGFMAAFKDTDNHLRRMKPQWLTQTREGELVGEQNPFVWMNPMHPEAQDFLMGIVLDAVKHYDIDGVQLDDRIAWPVEMGYDDYTIERYRAEHGGEAPPSDPRDADWVKWRSEQVDAFAERFYRELKAADPDLIVSISPAVYPWSYENYACNWPKWMAAGLMDEFVPQVYRTTYDRFAEDWRRQVDEAQQAGRPGDLLAGIRVVGDGPPTAWDDLQKMIELSQQTPTGGHVHWFSRGVLEVYPQELEAFYEAQK